ncbi:methyl-accepting chemotaxis protein [Anaerocolumna aminovalerica]|jgi:methyl-accepting chemotaxis protein|uniref:Methyl-accepting chemotaxis protein n=1 Tax=Anaerocolumna aminovalerica TaxID=1527 RepID=A0A1I5F8V6_9FIRM|nr:methyl-accepting chemotaxis protein [Anaerocolumna aminovalerica]MBU5334044.1 methyl-accepting chemotaxis protein [Anaerocolumna aminovalerica]MDU6266245.1 methyl-accepting chemotaxis protein [Anaerocolumna aminovalerica]SFO19751.1 methyl-accepting chemotaxis protein [Anaerocolumna aminovalerica]
MKIKWKIVLVFASLIVAAITVINVLYYFNISRFIENEHINQLSGYSKTGYQLLDNKYPGDWKVEGEKLYKGDILLNDNYEFVDGFAKDANIQVTIFLGDTRITTSIKDAQAKRLVGTQASDIVVNKVLTHNEDYLGKASIVGREALTYYVPIQNSDGTAIGMWFVGIYLDDIGAQIIKVVTTSIIVSAVILMAGCLITYIIGNTIGIGFNKIRTDLEDFENGKFNHSFNIKYMNRKDEIGAISKSYSNMQTHIKSIILSIKEEILKIERSSEESLLSVNEVYNNIENISVTTEELSAGMEETAASTQEMNASIHNMESEVDEVARKAEQGENIVKEIKKRAEQLQQEAQESHKNTMDIFESTSENLRNSIKKSSAIEEIKALSQSILHITNQTNMLALNASIESARAGEAGKGFAVVAHEIGNLAVNSKEAATQIENITTEVSEAVKALVKDAATLLDYVEHTVIEDYGVLVHTGEQYYTDANTVNEMVTEIKRISDQLQTSIHYVKQAIQEVAAASNQGAEGASVISEKSTSIVTQTEEVVKQTQANKESVDVLNEMVQFFQI